MAITTRSGKGSILTHADLDNNFTELDTRLQISESETLQELTDRGATSTNKIKVPGIELDREAPVTATEGVLSWNNTDKTLEVGLENGNAVLQIGQEQHLYARNETGTLISNGQVVRITGSTGTRPTVELAGNDLISTQLHNTIGVVTHDIANNAQGYITTNGLVRDMNTSTFNEGGELWLGTNGTLTSTRPVFPSAEVRIGWCIRSHASLGVIYVDVDIAQDLKRLHDVNTTNIQDGDTLVWNATDEVFQPGAGGGGGSSVTWTSEVVPAVATDIVPDASIITDDTASLVTLGRTFSGRAYNHYLCENAPANFVVGFAALNSTSTLDHEKIEYPSYIKHSTAPTVLRVLKTDGAGSIIADRIFAIPSIPHNLNDANGMNAGPFYMGSAGAGLDMYGIALTFTESGSSWTYRLEFTINSTTLDMTITQFSHVFGSRSDDGIAHIPGASRGFYLDIPNFYVNQYSINELVNRNSYYWNGAYNLTGTYFLGAATIDFGAISDPSDLMLALSYSGMAVNFARGSTTYANSRITLYDTGLIREDGMGMEFNDYSDPINVVECFERDPASQINYSDYETINNQLFRVDTHNVNIVSGGTGYSVNDTITVSVNGASIQFKVIEIDAAGIIQKVTLNGTGNIASTSTAFDIATEIASYNTPTAATGGSGSGASISLNVVANAAWYLTDPNAGYDIATNSDGTFVDGSLNQRTFITNSHLRNAVSFDGITSSSCPATIYLDNGVKVTYDNGYIRSYHGDVIDNGIVADWIKTDLTADLFGLLREYNHRNGTSVDFGYTSHADRNGTRSLRNIQIFGGGDTIVCPMSYSHFGLVVVVIKVDSFGKMHATDSRLVSVSGFDYPCIGHYNHVARKFVMTGEPWNSVNPADYSDTLVPTGNDYMMHAVEIDAAGKITDSKVNLIPASRVYYGVTSHVTNDGNVITLLDDNVVAPNTLSDATSHNLTTGQLFYYPSYGLWEATADFTLGSYAYPPGEVNLVSRGDISKRCHLVSENTGEDVALIGIDTSFCSFRFQLDMPSDEQISSTNGSDIITFPTTDPTTISNLYVGLEIGSSLPRELGFLAGSTVIAITNSTIQMSSVSNANATAAAKDVTFRYQFNITGANYNNLSSLTTELNAVATSLSAPIVFTYIQSAVNGGIYAVYDVGSTNRELYVDLYGGTFPKSLKPVTLGSNLFDVGDLYVRKDYGCLFIEMDGLDIVSTSKQFLTRSGLPATATTPTPDGVTAAEIQPIIRPLGSLDRSTIQSLGNGQFIVINDETAGVFGIVTFPTKTI